MPDEKLENLSDAVENADLAYREAHPGEVTFTRQAGDIIPASDPPLAELNALKNAVREGKTSTEINDAIELGMNRAQVAPAKPSGF